MKDVYMWGEREMIRRIIEMNVFLNRMIDGKGFLEELTGMVCSCA